jgi:hypothetical protein
MFLPPRPHLTTVKCLLFVLSVAVLCNYASGQTTSTVHITPGTPTTLSLPHLYWHLLMYQNHLDSAAAANEKQGKDGSWLREHIQQRIGITDAEFTPVRESAQRLKKTIAAIDAKAQAIVKADRAQYGKGLLPAGVQPPGWSQLKDLNQERETAITDEISKLNDALGSDNATKLQKYIQTKFSANVTKSPVQPPFKFPHKTSSAAALQEVQP